MLLQTQESHDAVLEALYQAHAHELRGFARRRVGRQEAEDIVQDAYLHLLQRGAVGALEHPRAYLFRIASNLAVDAVRKTRTRSRFAEDEIEFLSFAANEVSPEAAAEDASEMRQFNVCLAELPPLCRQAFILNRIDGLTYVAIAKRLGISIRTVDRHMGKALTHLRRRFQRSSETAAA